MPRFSAGASIQQPRTTLSSPERTTPDGPKLCSAGGHGSGFRTAEHTGGDCGCDGGRECARNYDFVTYAYFAVYIGRTFFPASTPFLSLLLSVGVFGVGFIFRPLGGVLIGAYADRVGRRPAMLLTIGMVTVGTIGLALTPSYAAIGIAAPLIVVFCRLVQGLALGGDVGPATAFLLEIAPPGQRGLYASWQIASQGASGLTAGGIGLVLSFVLSQADLAAWAGGCRSCFVCCCFPSLFTCDRGCRRRWRTRGHTVRHRMPSFARTRSCLCLPC